MENIFEIPPIILERHAELCDLVQNKSVDYHIDAKQLAAYYRRDLEYIRNCINTGGIKFAFAPYGGGRAVSQIGVLPLYCFEMQNWILTIVQDKKIM